MIDLDVEMEVARGAIKKHGSREAALGKVPHGVAQVLATAIRKRVAKEGKPAQPFRGYETEGIRFISPRYPVSGGREGPSGVKVFDSTADFQRSAGTKKGSFSASGGMWAGLRTVIQSQRAAVKFRGRSEGQGMALGVRLKGQKANEPHFRKMASGQIKARPRKVSNALKAATVLGATRINVLALTAKEFISIRDALMMISQRGIGRLGPAGVEWGPVRSRDALARRIFEEVEKLT